MISIDEKLRMLQPVLGTIKAQNLRQMYFFSDDFREKKEIENYIDLLISRLVKKQIEEEIILPPPAKELCEGDINLGEVEYLGRKIRPFNLKLRDINRHVGIFGQTGSGKTTLAKEIVRKLHARNIPFIIIDWEASYRDLALEYEDIEVLTVGKDINPLHLNMLHVPPGITKEEYIKSLIAIMAEDYLSGAGSDSIFLQYMKMVFNEKQQPAFPDLKEIILREIQNDMKGRGRLSGRSGLWKETVGRIIQFLSAGSSGNVINTNKHYPIEKLMNRNVVLEFGGIKSPRDRSFFIHLIINNLMLHNEFNGLASENLKHVIILEEAHNLIMKSTESLIGKLAREVRKYGTGLIFLDQTPSEITNEIFANLNVKIGCALGTYKDISAMSKAMNLDSEKSRFFGMLKTGQAIINVKQRHHESFLIRPPLTRQERNISDEELRKAMGRFSKDNHEEVPGNDFLSLSNTAQQTESFPPLVQKHLSPLEKCLLQNIAEHPFDGVDTRTKRLGLHPKDMCGLHESLTAKGIVKCATAGNKKLFEITEAGKEVAGWFGINIKKQDTRGGIEHSYGINEIVQFLRKHGFKPVCEVSGIDIVDEESSLAVEAETGKSNIISNLAKLENSRFSRRFMIAINKVAEFKIRKAGQNFPLVKIMHIKDFLKLTREELTASPALSIP